MDEEERADREEAEGKYKEFDNVRDLITELKGPGTMRPCNNPSCTTCLCDCLWRRDYGL
jgi:hypothetical protein